MDEEEIDEVEEEEDYLDFLEKKFDRELKKRKDGVITNF